MRDYSKDLVDPGRIERLVAAWVESADAMDNDGFFVTIVAL